MSVTWEAVATRRVDLLVDALRDRMRLPPGCQWLTYLRSHDDIGWGFADEDALAHAIDPAAHRRFLNDFYSGEHPGSFARGERFQDNPRTGDARISGTLASLAGLEAAIESGSVEMVERAVDRILAMETIAFTSVGIPMLYLGDEIGTLNDSGYAAEPGHAGDNRWMHRPVYDWNALAQAEDDPTSPGGRLLAGVRKLVRFRRERPAFGGSLPLVIPSGHEGVVAYARRGGGDRVLIVVNLSDSEARAALPETTERWIEVGTDQPLDVGRPLELRPYGVVMAVAGKEPDLAPGQVG
jgi:amylosucrase